jgi:23S rRNA (uracil1939-C5)-methyltransferase
LGVPAVFVLEPDPATGMGDPSFVSLIWKISKSSLLIFLFTVIMEMKGAMDMAYEVTGIKMNDEGKCLVDIDGTLHAVKNLMPGEKARVTKTDHVFKVVKYIQPDDHRQKPPCPIFDACGGCQLQMMAYEKQLAYKRDLVATALHANELNEIVVLPTIGMKNMYRYRNKNTTVLSIDKGKLKSGFYEENSHQVIHMDDCRIQDEKANKIITDAIRLIKKHKLPVYDEDTMSGLIKHIMVRFSDTSGEYMLVIVTKTDVFPGRKNFAKAMKKKHPAIKTVVQNVNERQTSIVLGNRNQTIYGPGFIVDRIDDISFAIYANTFYQVNHEGMRKLYDLVVDLSKVKETDVVVDAYSGIGTLSLMMAKRAKKTIGIEANDNAVQAAIKNASFNKIKNARFLTGDVNQKIDQLLAEGQHVDIVIVDPPRSGLESSFITKMVALKPRKIVYVSCHPETFARDLKRLRYHGYKSNMVQPVDMFPQTYHVETVGLLSLK